MKPTKRQQLPKSVALLVLVERRNQRGDPMPKRKDCPFPGCTGGCTGCVQVQIDQANKPMHQVAQRVLADRDVLNDLVLNNGELLTDIMTLVEYVLEAKRPKWNLPLPTAVEPLSDDTLDLIFAGRREEE
jgi:hypothetical protein